ncbi:sensor histidine kinase [Sandarakinorhabdus cyanobacteriorum]|uniref:Sensor histidine kinase n=1 Tax=Sandarakinorhabdus cyanobacteriorum TaxID=1981098 RepID=A0A255Y955_9SPHN|nr:histidine kinase [Sandarakinorhabdus cyanobacteriorum]OYQ25673.1 sensor histidine kinase [Sandarakinorhabdus cyanobacteriorum]
MVERVARGFFHDKNRAFWLLQGGGWLAYFLLRALSGLANSMGLAFVLPAIIVTATGASITLLLAAAYRRLITMKPLFTWTATALLLVSASALFSALEVWAHATFYQPGWQPKGVEFLGAILLDFSVLGAWTGLYYGINYYLLLAEQSERMLTMAAQANNAQLAMLRYQLNPHFLFNTLNSISTLVLLKQTDRANAMLSRLASFLRYSLVGEREGLATVAQEAEALKLYLDIERTRFESRLRTRFDIAPDVMEARLPSLLLQPLIENAIKYAVTPAEDGADILVDARRMADRLVITIADTGPGLGGVAPEAGGTGVGLTNIRERLAQSYGPDHRFELADNEPHGLIVLIDVPYQTDAQSPQGSPPPLAAKPPLVANPVAVPAAAPQV